AVELPFNALAKRLSVVFRGPFEVRKLEHLRNITVVQEQSSLARRLSQQCEKLGGFSLLLGRIVGFIAPAKDSEQASIQCSGLEPLIIDSEYAPPDVHDIAPFITTNRGMRLLIGIANIAPIPGHPVVPRNMRLTIQVLCPRGNVSRLSFGLGWSD